MIASPADIDPTRAASDTTHPDGAPADEPLPIPSHFPPDWPHLLVQDLLTPGLDFHAFANRLGLSFDALARLITSAEVQAESDALQLLAATRSRLLATSAAPRSISQLIAIVDTPLPHNSGMTPEAESRAYCRHADLVIRAINALARHTRPSPAPDNTRTKPRRTTTRPSNPTPSPNSSSSPTPTPNSNPNSNSGHSPDSATDRRAERPSSPASAASSGATTRVPLVPVESASADETEPVPTDLPSSPLPIAHSPLPDSPHPSAPAPLRPSAPSPSSPLPDSPHPSALPAASDVPHSRHARDDPAA